MRILKDDFKQKFSIEMICHLVQEERITKNILKYECYSMYRYLYMYFSF